MSDQPDLLLDITQTITIDASPEIVFEGLLHRVGPGSVEPSGKPLPMKLERWPGGRWFRDLGDETGHLWGFVQVYKPPRLLEVQGPLFMSFAATSHVQWRVEEEEGGTTRLTVRHRALGPIDDDMRAALHGGWRCQLEGVKADSE